MNEPLDSEGSAGGPEPVAVRHLDELDEITRAYARITEREGSAWTFFAAGVWIVGAEVLLQASPLWGRLAFLALVPAALAAYVLEKRMARPHGVVAYAPGRREHDALRQARIWTVLVALLGEWLALYSLYQVVDGIGLLELPDTAIPVVLVLFPAVAAAPAVAPFLTPRGVDGPLVVLGPLTIASAMASRLPGGGSALVPHLVALGVGGVLALLALLGIWVRRTQLRLLDQRMAHLRERLR